MKIGTPLVWLTAPKCGCARHDGRKVEFRRLVDSATAEVMTCNGSRNVPVIVLQVP